LNILHVIPSVSAIHGGPSNAIKVIEGSLASAGHQVTTLTTDDDGPGRRFESADLPTAAPGIIRIYKRKRIDFYKVAPGLIGWLWSNVGRFDIVHIHALFSFSSLVTAMIARQRRIPYIIRPLGTLTSYGMNKRRPALKWLSFVLFERQILKAATAVHFTSEQEFREAKALNVPMRGVVIPLALGNSLSPKSQQNTAAYQTNDSLNTILFMSRIDPKKNLEGLLRAFSLISKDGPRTILLIAGDGNRQYENSLRTLSSSLELDSRIEWLGHVDGAQKEAALARANVFVLPSFSENFGIVVLEALSAGLPCIVGRKVALADQIEAAGAGIAVDTEPSAIADGLKMLLANASERNMMGQRARQLVEKEFTAERMADRLIALYKDISIEKRATVNGQWSN
jgi:glycosyltransferase involved in cell wall biosynthesis